MEIVVFVLSPEVHILRSSEHEKMILAIWFFSLR